MVTCQKCERLCNRNLLPKGLPTTLPHMVIRDEAGADQKLRAILLLQNQPVPSFFYSPFCSLFQWQIDCFLEQQDTFQADSHPLCCRNLNLVNWINLT